MTSDRSRKQPSALSNVMMGPNLRTQRGRATVGVVPLLKDRMGGGGMRPLIIIRPIYIPWDEFQTWIREERIFREGAARSLQPVLSCVWKSSSPPFTLRTFIISTAFLHNNDSAENAFFPILHYYCQYAELKATWLSDGDRPSVWGGGGGGGRIVQEPFWFPSHNCQPYINT